MESTSKKRSKRPVSTRAPSRDELHEAALRYLGERSASRATLRRALDRKIQTWARRAERAGQDAEAIRSEVTAAETHLDPILARFTEVGLLNDVAYATSRAKSLSRGGKSRRAIEAHLTQKGISRSTIRDVVPEDASAELAAALVLAKKRRIGPFARPDRDGESRDEPKRAKQRALAALARAGFSYSTCERALSMDLEEAEERLRSRE